MLNKSKKKYLIFVFYLCYNLLLFKLIIGQFSVLGVKAINEQTELSETLDNDHVHAAAKGVIVQPFWTLEKNGKTESVKVQVNQQNRKETAALRAEIEEAISKDSYATAGATKSKDIKSLEASLKTNEKNKASLLSTESKQWEKEPLTGDSFSQPFQESNSAAPNIVTTNFYDDSEFDMRKLQQLKVTKRRTREILVVKYIEEDFAFDLGAEVKEWKHIVHADQEYFIGRRTTDLLLVRKRGDKYERAMVVEIGHIINYIESYTYWNMEQEHYEGVILIATADKILWYRANHKTQLIELYWQWVVGNIITGLTHFDLDSKNYLTISSNQSFLAGHYALNIYEYNLEAKEFWIAQRLQLEYPCEEITVLNTGRDIILAIPQNNTAEIYTFNPHEVDHFHIRFQLKRSVAAEGIATIAGFQMGGHSYLAITGYQPQILLYQQGDFIPKTLLDSNFGWVELFFPIPVRTYRDDLILLVQHRVNFSTHSLTVVETLIWDGEAFETSIPIPCHLGKHVVYGVGCIMDLHRDEGLRGAALLKRGEEVSVIVPRHKAESGLFRFHTELLPKNSELLDLQEIFDFLKGWVNEQNNLIAETEALLQLLNEEIPNIEPPATSIETLKTSQFELNGEAEEIHINDYKWTEEDSNVELEFLIQQLEDLEKHLHYGRQRRNLDNVQHDELHFDEVIVEDLEVDKVNGEKYFIQNDELHFDGLLNIPELDVYGRVTNLPKKQVNDQDVVLYGNLEFDKINDVNWSDIKNNLIFKNIYNSFENLEVKGKVLVGTVLNITTLNTLNFPDDYMLSNSPVTSTVTAKKHFANSVIVSSVDTSGLVNGKNPMDAITLTGVQDWQGKPIFRHLEVTEALEYRGQVYGGQEIKIPTLQESRIINTTCHFDNLIINGPLVLKGNIDGKPLGSFLKDIIPKPENPSDEISITSSKFFNEVTFPNNFQLENQAISKIAINEFVTTNTNQTLNLATLEGQFYFNNLILNGSYDGIKIEDLLNEVILLDEAVDLSTTELIFNEKLQANSVTILNTLNEHKIKDSLQTLQEDLIIDSAEFESLHAQQADFSNDILGEGTLNNIELHSHNNERSWHEPYVRSNIYLKELILKNGIKADELHFIAANALLEFVNRLHKLPDMVLNDYIQIDNITVTGNVQLHKLNGLLFDEELQLTTVKLQHPNYLTTNLRFSNRLDIKGQLNVVADFRGNYLPDLIDDIIIRTNDSCITITAPKSFLQPVQVAQNTEVKALNGIPMSSIAWKTKFGGFNGVNVQLKGNLWVKNLNLQGTINNLDWQELEKLLYFDENLQNFVLKNTIDFQTPAVWEDLTVKGDLNNVRNLTDFFENLSYKNNIVILNGENTFTGRVSIDQGALIRNLNDVDLVTLLNNIAFVHGTQPIIIQAPITFKDSIQAKDIQIQKSLIAEYLSGCSLAEWLNNTLRVDQDENITHPLNFAAGSLDGNSLVVDFINDIDLSRIITLNTPQTFIDSIRFSEVTLNGFISVKGRVNDVDLEKEFNNTLIMNHGQQHVQEPLTIATIKVLGNLVIKGVVNGNKNLSDVATLQEDLVFESPIYFKTISSPLVIFKDLVTGINFTEWFESAVKCQYPATQYITGNWSTKYLTIRTAPKEFHDFEPWQYYSFRRLVRNDNSTVYEDDELCALIKEIWQDIAKKPVFIKHIEECFNFDFEKELRSNNESLNKLFAIKSRQEHFLVINLKCESLVYQWLSEEEKFVFKFSFESGPINEIVIIPAYSNSKNLQFITNFERSQNTDCDLKDIKKWQVLNDSLVLDGNLPGSPDLLYLAVGTNSSLWTLGNESITELDLDYKIKQKWQLPIEKNQTRYRFVPSKQEHEILLTNGEQLVLIFNHLANESTKSVFKSQQPHVQFINFNNSHFPNTVSLLKPNNTVIHSLVLGELKPILERILTGLIERLNQQVVITQLSMPESDLFDEHLIPDFLAIMEELQNQNIYDAKVFNISLKNIMVPETTSQILAVRVVQITWPVVLELEKMHSRFKPNADEDHPLCNCIAKSLGILINDVLLLANNKGNNSNDASLTEIIQSIREFETQVHNILEAYTSYFNTEAEFENIKQQQLQESTTNLELIEVPQNQSDVMFIKNSFLPGYGEGEILSLTVGSVLNPHQLWAVTNINVTNNTGIYIYQESTREQLYQVIPALQPRSLQQLRIKQETLLLYVQGCCQVEIWKYRGSQGFTPFATITRNETIKQILTISVPSNRANLKYFLILLLERNIKFYEFKLEGYDVVSPFIPANCL